MHGASSDAVQAEPNLVPLLDLVFQLIMFFLMVVNFVTEQVNRTIMLPSAQSARPMDKRIEGPLFLNMDAEGRLLVPGQKPLATLLEIRYYLQQCYQDAERVAKAQGDAQVKSVVILRAHKKADYAHVYHVLRMCKEAGFRRLQLRAQIQSGG
jgi:biopolymer transport protein ExbD